MGLNTTPSPTQPVSLADGQAVTFGAQADAAAAGDTSTATYVSLFKRLLQRATSLIALLPAALGRTTMAGSLSVAVASDQTAIPVSGTVTANQGGAPWSAAGAAASGAAKSGNPVQVGHVFNTTQPTVTSGQAVESQGTARGGLIVATGADTFNVTVNAALPAGTAVIGALAANQSVNQTQWSGTAVDTNSGTKSAGTLRVVLATDQPALANKLLVTPDAVALPAHQSTNLDQWGGVAPTAAALLADAASLPTAPTVGAAGMIYDDYTGKLVLARGCSAGTALASAARTGSASITLDNFNSRGVLVVLSVTAASGTGGLTLTINALDTISALAVALTAAPAAVTAAGRYGYELYPGATTAAPGTVGCVVQRTAGALPRVWKVIVTAGDASSYTYSVSYSLIP